MKKRITALTMAVMIALLCTLCACSQDPNSRITSHFGRSLSDKEAEKLTDSLFSAMFMETDINKVFDIFFTKSTLNGIQSRMEMDSMFNPDCWEYEYDGEYYNNLKDFIGDYMVDYNHETDEISKISDVKTKVLYRKKLTKYEELEYLEEMRNEWDAITGEIESMYLVKLEVNLTEEFDEESPYEKSFNVETLCYRSEEEWHCVFDLYPVLIFDENSLGEHDYPIGFTYFDF